MVYPCWGLFSVYCHPSIMERLIKQIWRSMCTGSCRGSGGLVARVQSRPVYNESVVDTAAVGHVALGELRFLQPVSFHKHFIRANSSTTDHAHDMQWTQWSVTLHLTRSAALRNRHINYGQHKISELYVCILQSVCNLTLNKNWCQFTEQSKETNLKLVWLFQRIISIIAVITRKPKHLQL